MRRAALLCLLLATIVLGAATPVIAQLRPSPGTYELDWAILHNPVSSDLPTLEAGTRTITLEDDAGRCPRPTSVFIVLNAPASRIQAGADQTIIWCLTAEGAFEESPSGPAFGGGWSQYTETHAIIEAEQGSRSNDRVIAVARRPASPPPPPPPSTLRVFITQPRNNETVSGTAWVVMWVEGTSGSSNVFTLSANSTQVGTTTTSSRGPVTMPWNTRSVTNGTHTLTATVRDAAGNTGTTSITVIVRN
jgi:Bacterial Ig domain